MAAPARDAVVVHLDRDHVQACSSKDLRYAGTHGAKADNAHDRELSGHANLHNIEGLAARTRAQATRQ
jgi:hypothetical protein